jgi:hypothetical protein
MPSLHACTKNSTQNFLSLLQSKHTHTHICTLSQTCLAMMNAQPCLIGKTHTQACTSSFSAILECAGRPLRMHARANTHTRAHTQGRACQTKATQQRSVCQACRPVQKTEHKTSFTVAKTKHAHAVAKKKHAHAHTHKHVNAQACLIEKTHSHACTSSFSAILECAGRPFEYTIARTRTHTYAPGVLCHDTEKQHTEACSLHANTHECSISHSNCFGGNLKQQVPEHSIQYAQCSRQDHLSLLMLECIMVLCVWLECRQRQRWASCHAFYAHAPMTQMK